MFKFLPLFFQARNSAVMSKVGTSDDDRVLALKERLTEIVEVSLFMTTL